MTLTPFFFFFSISALRLDSIWAHHLCAVTIDEGWSGVVDRDREMRLRYQAAEKVVEESFNLRAAQWVFSATVSHRTLSKKRWHSDSGRCKIEYFCSFVFVCLCVCCLLALCVLTGAVESRCL